MTAPLPPQYNPALIERDLYQWWLDRDLWRARLDDPRPSYVVMLPPPNVTASLHMGHGLNQAIQDALVRFERMRGRNTLWLPGTDHAGIATQNVVERVLSREGRTRFDMGRAAFVQRVWDHVHQTGNTILEQMRALGSSCDWSRTYFTLDDKMSHAVREAFVRLYEKGLIYRGKYIINWCPRCLTALSNEEAEKEETAGRLWHLRYPLEEGKGHHLVVATTRPETMLGDTGIAVHPDDSRYHHLIGRKVRLPLVGRLIPIVADAAIDPAFGTGVVKVTPAHDPVDFEIGGRHGLPPLDIMTPDARMNDSVPERFRGLDRFEARKRVVAEFEAEGLLEKVADHQHAVGHCYRCHTMVEPRLSDQWFVRMAPLARPALEAYRTGRLRFIPERRGDDYAHWMEQIRDWCISRQIWWGHRIPVWYCDTCGTSVASRTDLTECRGCHGPVRQDEDVLDTWFSSQLVPFSALGWPERTPDLKAFYPGHTMVTAPEILFFWVARMVMLGLEFMGELPFTAVYLHGTVRDTQHRKMSKSLGNGIDPLEVISRFGADALRYTALTGAAVGTDVILDPADLDSSFAAGRHFANKLWNAGRFILGNLDGPTRPLAGTYSNVVDRSELQLADRWIIARCDATVREATQAYEKFRLNEAVAATYRFLWDDLADWYIEQVKPRLYGDQPGGEVARAVLAATFEVALRLLHPAMPFITEALWRRLPGRAPDDSISTAAWPAPDDRATDPAALTEFATVQEIVTAIRSIRAEYAVPPGHAVRAALARLSPVAARAVAADEATIRRLAKVSALTIESETGPSSAGHAVLRDGTTVSVPLGDLIDVEKECARLGGELERLLGQIRGQEGKLANEQFVAKAPAAVVQAEREKLVAWRDKAEVLRQKRAQLGCAG